MHRVIAAFAALILLGICACATHPPKAQRAPADTPLAVIGEFECGEMYGTVVITADGAIHSIADTDINDLAALSKLVPPGHAAAVNLTNNCPPRSKT